MAQRSIFNCDICGAEQAETNHWFIAVFLINPRRMELRTLKGNENSILGAEIFHLCGDQCVMKTVNRFLGQKEEA